MAETEPGPADDSWGRILDAAGILAGLLLIVIIADIATDGKVISRYLRPRGGDLDQPAN